VRTASSVDRHGCFGHGLPRRSKKTQSPLPFVWKKILAPQTGHSTGCVSDSPRSQRACPTAQRAEAGSRGGRGGLATEGATGRPEEPEVYPGHQLPETWNGRRRPSNHRNSISSSQYQQKSDIHGCPAGALLRMPNYSAYCQLSGGVARELHRHSSKPKSLTISHTCLPIVKTPPVVRYPANLTVYPGASPPYSTLTEPPPGQCPDLQSLRTCPSNLDTISAGTFALSRFFVAGTSNHR